MNGEDSYTHKPTSNKFGDFTPAAALDGKLNKVDKESTSPRKPENEHPVSQAQAPLQWLVGGESIKGSSHVRMGLPNQDAIKWIPETGVGKSVILAVADGHGSAKCSRSDRGARLAVDVATQVILQFLKGQEGVSNFSNVKHLAEERLAQEIVRIWTKTVEEDLEREPLSSEEIERLKLKGDHLSTDTKKSRAQSMIAYGTTLLAVAATESFLLFVQIGDGDILVVTDSGDVMRPLPGDERFIANETTSLCSANASRDFRIYMQVIPDTPPALILLSTDGYSNSFLDERNFTRVGEDLLNMFILQGAEHVNTNLHVWLSQASQQGSGDDVTLGLIRRSDIDSYKKKVLQTVKEKTVLQNQLNALQDRYSSELKELNTKLDNTVQELQTVREENRQYEENASRRPNGLFLQRRIIPWIGIAAFGIISIAGAMGYLYGRTNQASPSSQQGHFSAQSTNNTVIRNKNAMATKERTQVIPKKQPASTDRTTKRHDGH